MPLAFVINPSVNVRKPSVKRKNLSANSGNPSGNAANPSANETKPLYFDADPSVNAENPSYFARVPSYFVPSAEGSAINAKGFVSFAYNLGLTTTAGAAAARGIGGYCVLLFSSPGELGSPLY